MLFMITSAILNKLPLKGLKKMTSASFTPAAAPKAQRTRQQVIHAIGSLWADGIPKNEITTRRVAEVADCSHTTAGRQAKGQSWGDFVTTHYGPY